MGRCSERGKKYKGITKCPKTCDHKDNWRNENRPYRKLLHHLQINRKAVNRSFRLKQVDNLNPRNLKVYLKFLSEPIVKDIREAVKYETFTKINFISISAREDCQSKQHTR